MLNQLQITSSLTQTSLQLPAQRLLVPYRAFQTLRALAAAHCLKARSLDRCALQLIAHPLQPRLRPCLEPESARAFPPHGKGRRLLGGESTLLILELR